MEHLFDVISEDDEILVINKPAGLVCHPTKGDVYSSLISRVRLFLGASEQAHLINRLDRETSGIVVIAKTAEANARLRKLWESRAVEKVYLAIVHGALSRAQIIDAPLGPDPDSQIAIKDKVRPDGAQAITNVYPQKVFYRKGLAFTLVRILLQTGRKHQIRIHLAYIGHSIVGDKLYGSDENLYLAFVRHELTPEQQSILLTENQCLHAARISFDEFGVSRTFVCSPEKWFIEFAQQKGPSGDGPLAVP